MWTLLVTVDVTVSVPRVAVEIGVVLVLGPQIPFLVVDGVRYSSGGNHYLSNSRRVPVGNLKLTIRTSISVSNSLCMEMFVIRMDFEAFSSDEQSIRHQSCVFAAFHAAKATILPRRGAIYTQLCGFTLAFFTISASRVYCLRNRPHS